jgi:hypothetical protein
VPHCIKVSCNRPGERRANVLLRFECVLGCGRREWLTADQVLDRHGHTLLLQFVHELRAHGELPAPDAVSTFLAGYPCQELSLANRQARQEGLLDGGQVSPIELHLSLALDTANNMLLFPHTRSLSGADVQWALRQTSVLCAPCRAMLQQVCPVHQLPDLRLPQRILAHGLRLTSAFTVCVRVIARSCAHEPS